MMRQDAQRKGLKFGFLGETIAELKKVTWLTRQEVTYLTILVLIVCLIAGLILGAVDYLFSSLVNILLGV